MERGGGGQRGEIQVKREVVGGRRGCSRREGRDGWEGERARRERREEKEEGGEGREGEGEAFVVA
jgi:hypothetical protein